MDSVNHEGGTRSEIVIWQQNVNKSQTGQHDLISSGKLAYEGIDIVALQEPAINYLGKTIAARDWIPIYPSTHEKEPGKSRSLMLINANIPTESWEQVEFPSGDVTVVRISGSWGRITIFNIYNDCLHDRTIHELTRFHRTNHGTLIGNDTTSNTAHVVWVGDFNRHHPAWDRPEDSRLFTRETLEAAETLIKATADLQLDMALPAGIPTHHHFVTKKWSRLDQVFVTENTTDILISCEAKVNDKGLNTDHIPIVTRLDVKVGKTPETKTNNYRNVDWEKFRESLKASLQEFGVPSRIKDQAALNRECERLTLALQETTKKEVPTTDVCPKSKRWWTREIGDLRSRFRKMGRKVGRYSDQPEHPIHAEYKDAHRQYDRAIKYSKRNHWRDWLEKASDPDLWTANKYLAAAASDGGRTRIPTLRVSRNGQDTAASSNQEKSRMLAEAFFPKKPTAMPTSDHLEYPQPICGTHKISKEQIRRQLKRLKPYKAPGPDGIPNIVLMKCADLLVDRLWYIYSAILERELCYDPWKQFTTVVLRKPGKPRYDVPKAYRPIALLNTMGKLLTAIVTEQLTYYTEKHSLLPPNHFGGRPGRTTTDALHALTYRIKDAWRKRQVVSVLFLDIEGAFPNAVNERLIHNLRMRKVPTKIVKFIQNLLNGRNTTLKFDDFVSERIALDNGIGQGDPLSMILYQYYNADILNVPSKAHESASAYVDDAILVATAKNFTETHNILADMMNREGGAIEWSIKHNSKFEFSKLALIDFAHRNCKKERPNLETSDFTITPTQSTKYLGVYLDQHLSWNTHIAHAIKKGADWSSRIRRAAVPSWGLTPKHARKLFISVALPKILYAVDVWGIPKPFESTAVTKRGTSGAVAKLTSTQRAGTLAITGGLRTTPTDVLDLHAFVMPLHLEIDKVCHRAASRIATLPPAHPLYKPARFSSNPRTKRHKSPLHQLMQTYAVKTQETETISPAPRNPALTHKRPFSISIAESKDDSIEEDSRASEAVRIYTDRSAQEGKVGAAALLIRQGEPNRVLHYHLGSSSNHTVHEAELVGILLGLHLIKTDRKGRTSYALGIDNQAAISALNSVKATTGQHIANEILETAARIKKQRNSSKYSLTVRWTAGHVGIEGNEEVDGEAKKAAEGCTSVKKALPPLLRKALKNNKSALRQSRKEKLKKRWQQEWDASDRAAKYNSLGFSSPSNSFIKLISDDNLSRNDASRIFQLRAGHVPLNGYLERFKRTDSARCPACGHPRENVQHFLMDCPAYKHERWTLYRQSKIREPTLKALLNKEESAIPLAKYIRATGRFEVPGQEKALENRAR